ncbi:hypothetical protein RUND412_006266 [Rhizina undulata]
MVPIKSTISATSATKLPLYTGIRKLSILRPRRNPTDVPEYRNKFILSWIEDFSHPEKVSMKTFDDMESAVKHVTTTVRRLQEKIDLEKRMAVLKEEIARRRTAVMPRPVSPKRKRPVEEFVAIKRIKRDSEGIDLDIEMSG